MAITPGHDSGRRSAGRESEESQLYRKLRARLLRGECEPGRMDQWRGGGRSPDHDRWRRSPTDRVDEAKDLAQRQGLDAEAVGAGRPPPMNCRASAPLAASERYGNRCGRPTRTILERVKGVRVGLPWFFGQ